MIKQDDVAISVLRRKKVMPMLENYQSIRSSRQTYRSNVGIYWIFLTSYMILYIFLLFSIFIQLRFLTLLISKKKKLSNCMFKSFKIYFPYIYWIKIKSLLTFYLKILSLLIFRASKMNFTREESWHWSIRESSLSSYCSICCSFFLH